MAQEKVPCGIYRTQKSIGDTISAGVLVYYHNHGEPGPGVYLPSGWKNNRAKFHKNGKTVPDRDYANSLTPLAAEGLYRVAEPFHCCEKNCFEYHEGQLVQLGYNGKAQPLLFVPKWVDDELELPTSGTRIDEEGLDKLQLLKVARGENESDAEENPLLN
jgi:hypothetical protein